MENKDNNSPGQRSMICKVAGRLFIEQGYQDTSIRQIARELGVSPGLIGYYFPSKRDIAVELFSHQLDKFIELVGRYVHQEDPVLKSAVIIKLQITVLGSSVFRKFYLDALKEDIILQVISQSGLDTYQAINDKYSLEYSESYLQVCNLIAASMERTLMLYSGEISMERSIADMVFSMHMTRIYGDKAFIQEQCIKSELITARIICEHPELLRDWM